MINAHEMALVNAFIIKQKRGRILEMLASQKGRQKLVWALPHFKGLDPRFAQSINPGLQTPRDILNILNARGAAQSCHVISENHALDAREMLLSEALEEVVGKGYGALLSCIPGKLGYYEGEDPGRRFLLERSD